MNQGVYLGKNVIFFDLEILRKPEQRQQQGNNTQREGTSWKKPSKQKTNTGEEGKKMKTKPIFKSTNWQGNAALSWNLSPRLTHDTDL